MSGWNKLVAGRYRLTRQIGSGGMGRVWLARDEVLRRDIAVKEVVLPDDLTAAERDELIQRTLREARTAGRLSHPNVVAVYDVVHFEDRPWIVMEYVRSRSLYQVIKEDGPLAPKRAAEIGLAVLAALRAAHAAGVWHRDVKPGNVLLAEDGRVVLTDFGLATFDGDGSVTRSGLILGSAQYISPERARDGDSGPEADLWSLGATLYAAVEGRSPYARDTPMATLTALATAPPDTPRRAGPLRPVLIGLLRKNPRHRMSAAEAERLLRRVVAGDVRPRGRLGLRARDDGAAIGIAAAPAASTESDRLVEAARIAAQSRVRTVTEETFQRIRRRRRWPWLLGALAVALAAPASVLVIDGLSDRGALPTPPRGTSTVTPSLAAASEAMGVQACAAAPSSAGVAVRGSRTIVGVPLSLLPEWVYYQDPAGFHIGVPQGWRVWRVGSMLCFRDPKSSLAAAVIGPGRAAGDPLDLLKRSVVAWREATELDGYHEVALARRMSFDEAAQLEYTYVDEGIRLHGVNLLLRTKGQVFTLCWLGDEFRWQADSRLKDSFQPSFGLDR